MYKKIISLIFPIIIILGCSNNQVFKTRELNIQIENSKNYNIYQKDFLFMIKVLEDSHPNIFKNFPKKEFEAEKENLLKELETCNQKIEHQIKLQQFVARIKDAHTEVLLGNIYMSNYRYPIKYKWIEDKLYIIDTDKNLPKEWIGSQIKKINNLPINEIVDLGGSVISCENEIWKKAKIIDLLQNPEYLVMLKINDSIYSLKLTISIENEEKDITVYPYNIIKWRDSLTKHQITEKKNKAHFYKILPEEKTCYYQFNNFFDRSTIKFLIKTQLKWYLRPLANAFLHFKYEDYEEFLSTMFLDMEKDNVEKIIIDLRHNGGGNSALGNLFMYHCNIPNTIVDYKVSKVKLSELQKEYYEEQFNHLINYYQKKNPDKKITLPLLVNMENDKIKGKDSFFKNIENGETFWEINPSLQKFSGKIVILIGQETFSSASDFATILSDNEQATLIGEPIGQKPSSFGDKLSFTLPLTDTRVNVSYKYFQRPDSTKDDDLTLFPDIEIYPTIMDIMQGKDPVFNRAMNLK